MECTKYCVGPSSRTKGRSTAIISSGRLPTLRSSTKENVSQKKNTFQLAVWQCVHCILYWQRKELFPTQIMGKSNNKRSAAPSSSGGGGNAPVWTAADHAAASQRRSHNKTEFQQKRRAVLSHETKEKRDDIKLKLHITRVQRELEGLKSRLEAWDPVEEAERKRQEEERQRQASEEPAPKKRRKRGPKPETWKLKGAARPAWEVYDFDTRYVDPHIKAHEQAKQKAQRSINVLAVHKGKLATDGPEIARDYLALLMQLGYLNQDARKFKSARTAWLECMALEGDQPITTARESLMRMYLQVNKPDDALELGESLPDDSSVWIRYSLALVACQKKHEKAKEYLRKAIQANPLCAYYLAFLDIFDSAMEYTHEMEEADNEPESSLEEAIEYCTSGQEKQWQACGAALQLREMLLNALQGQDKHLSAGDVDWKDRLDKLEQELARRQRLKEIEEAGYYGPGKASLDEVEGSDPPGEKQGGRTTKGNCDDSKSHEVQSDVAGTDKAAAQSERSDSDSDEEGERELENDEEEEEEEEEEAVDISMYIGMFRTAMEMVEEDGFVAVSKE